MGGGALQPMSQAILVETFPREKHGMAMAIFGMGVVLAPVIGPTLGGWLTDDFSWRWIFFINIPVGVLSLLMTQVLVFDPPYLVRRSFRDGLKIDYTGSGLLALGLGSLEVVLDEGHISTGTIVDATILHAPSLTKNSSGKRDPEMHQTKKGNQWYFGAKAHIGVDSKETVVHSVATSAASVADKHMLPDLLHGDERKVWGDGGYQGQTEAIRAAAPKAQDMTCRRTKYKNYVDEEAKRKNTTKARVRAKVEWPFRILKRVFGFTKVRYRGIWKNHQWLCAAFALVNLYQHRNRLAPQGA